MGCPDGARGMKAHCGALGGAAHGGAKESQGDWRAEVEPGEDRGGASGSKDDSEGNWRKPVEPKKKNWAEAVNRTRPAEEGELGDWTEPAEEEGSGNWSEPESPTSRTRP